MKKGERFIVPSLTFKREDFLGLFSLIKDSIKTTKERTILLHIMSKNTKEEYKNLDVEKIYNFKEWKKAIILHFVIKGRIELKLSFSTIERNPLGPQYSEVVIEGSNDNEVIAVCQKIKDYFNHRKNYHYIFHAGGAYLAVPLSYVILYALNYDLTRLNLIQSLKDKYLFIGCILLSYPLKHFLRWLYPYFYLDGENKIRDGARYLISALLASLLANFIYAFIKK